MTELIGTPKNTDLWVAKAAKNDEFYTQWADIEREMNAYLEYNPDVFRGQVVLLPCDDPEWSNFTKFFALHFIDFGLKKLISTSYAADSNAADIVYQPTLFETAAHSTTRPRPGATASCSSSYLTTSTAMGSSTSTTSSGATWTAMGTFVVPRSLRYAMRPTS